MWPSLPSRAGPTQDTLSVATATIATERDRDARGVEQVVPQRLRSPCRNRRGPGLVESAHLDKRTGDAQGGRSMRYRNFAVSQGLLALWLLAACASPPERALSLH